MNTPAAFVSQNQSRYEQELCELLRIPSISANSQHKPDTARAANWVADQFRNMGLKTEVIETAGHPLVFAESPPVPGKPIALVYGHYDVQPPDPLAEWISPPFEPTIRNGNVYARGATDDKGQMLTHVKSVEAWLKTVGKLPLQVKFLIEGEEEVGSEQLYAYMPNAKEKLACNVIVISDTSQFAPGQPAITYSLRGISYYELRLQGPKQDLHSGVFGGAVTNPANALSTILAQLLDANGRIQIPGFYDDVLPLSPRERQEFGSLPFSDASFMQQIGVTGVTGEVGYSTLERRWARPTCDINGLWSGYQGEGSKTVLPAKAGAKFSFRLVPHQDPAKIVPAVKQFIASRIPPGITWELIEFHSAPAMLTPLESPYMSAAATAIEQGFQKRPVFIREGGSIPIATAFQQHLGADVLLMGWGLDDDNTHSPNEKFHLADFHRGIQASAQLWEELGKLNS
jgi:acetylornithine deacetylase/succinyl-diaminopimelate desuccinylase-like protein